MQRNVELLERVMTWIDDHPEQHNQAEWAKSGLDCGTAACFAGWSAILAFGLGVVHHGGFDLPAPYDLGCMSRSAGALLGLTEDECDTLFDATNSRDVLRLMVKDLVNGDVLRSVGEYECEADA